MALACKLDGFSRSYASTVGNPSNNGATTNVDGSCSPVLVLDTCHGKTFPSEGSRFLSQRFDRLPIHKMCSNQSPQRNSDIVLKNLLKILFPSRARRFLTANKCNKIIETGNQQDCLGMTPLHILACSGTYDLELYRTLIEKYPENLVTRDGWGDIPLLYAFWGNAPQEVVQLLVNKHKAMFPEHAIDWAGMVETLGRAPYSPGRARASLVCIQNVLSAQQSAFPDCQIDWQQAVAKWASEDTSRAKDREAQRFHQDTFKFLITVSISQRLSSLTNSKWRRELLRDIDESRWFVLYREKSTERIYLKLDHYEHLDKLREATSLLELVLWKTSMDTSTSNDQIEERERCRVRSGVEIVVPNVLPFLMPSQESIQR